MKDRPDRVKIKLHWQILRYASPVIFAVIGLFHSSQSFAESMNGDVRIVGEPLLFVFGKPLYNPLYFILSIFKYIYYEDFAPYYLNAIKYFLYWGILSLFIAFFWTIFINTVNRQNGNTQGTARLSEVKDLKENGLLNKHGVICGETADAIVLAKRKTKVNKNTGLKETGTGLSLRLVKPGKLICHSGDINTLIVGGTGMGKGVSFLIPTLCSYMQSMVIFDPKEENFEKTAGYRSTFSRVIKFAPCSFNTMRYNPVAAIRDGVEYAYRDSNLIADVIFAPSKVGGGQSDSEAYFSNSAKSIVTGALLYIRFCDYPDKTFKGLRDFLNGSNNLDALLNGSGGEANNDLGKAQAKAMANAKAYFRITEKMYHQKDYKITDDMYKSNKDHYDMLGKKPGDTGNYYEDSNIGIGSKIRSEYVESQLKATAADILNTNAKEKASVWKTIAAKIKDFDDPTLSYATGDSDFELEDFFNCKQPISLYLCVPYSDVTRISFVFRLIISLMLKRFSEGATSFGKIALAYNILFVLDEFPILGCFPDIAEVMGVLRGYGIFFIIVCQALNQLIDRYGPNHPFLDHCNVHIVGQIAKIEDAEVFSRVIGNETVHQTKISRSGSIKMMSDKNLNYSDNEMSRALFDAADIIRIPGNQFLLMVKGMQPYLGKKVVYYMDRRFKYKTRIKPPSSMEQLFAEVAGLPSQIRKKDEIAANKYRLEHTIEVENSRNCELIEGVYDDESDEIARQIDFELYGEDFYYSEDGYINGFSSSNKKDAEDTDDDSYETEEDDDISVITTDAASSADDDLYGGI